MYPALNTSSIVPQLSQEYENTTFLDLPDEMIDAVFYYLDFADRSRMRVNKRLTWIEGKTKVKRGGGDRWQTISIYEGNCLELILWIPDVTLPKTMYIVNIEQIVRLLKNVKIGRLSIMLDFTNENNSALISNLSLASLNELEMNNMNSYIFVCEKLNVDTLRRLIGSTAKVHLNNICSFLSAEDVANLREAFALFKISKAVESKSVKFSIEREVAFEYADHFFGLHLTSFKDEDTILRTNDQITIYRSLHIMNRYLREEDGYLSILTKTSTDYYSIVFEPVTASTRAMMMNMFERVPFNSFLSCSPPALMFPDVNTSSFATQVPQADEETTFLNLPNEMIEEVFSNLDFRDRSRLRVNKRLAEIEGKMKKKCREGGKRWQMVTIYESFSYELTLWINDNTLPKMNSDVSVEQIERLLKNVEIGILTITVDFEKEHHFALIPLLSLASVNELVIYQRNVMMYKCEKINVDNLRGLIQSSTKVLLKNIKVSFTITDIESLRMIFKSTKSIRTEFWIETKAALEYADQYFGLHPSSFELYKQEDPVRRTNDQISIYRYRTVGRISDFLNRYVREENGCLTVLSKVNSGYYRVAFESESLFGMLFRMKF